MEASFQDVPFEFSQIQKWTLGVEKYKFFFKSSVVFLLFKPSQRSTSGFEGIES